MRVYWFWPSLKETLTGSLKSVSRSKKERCREKNREKYQMDISAEGTQKSSSVRWKTQSNRGHVSYHLKVLLFLPDSCPWLLSSAFLHWTWPHFLSSSTNERVSHWKSLKHTANELFISIHIKGITSGLYWCSLIFTFCFPPHWFVQLRFFWTAVSLVHLGLPTRILTSCLSSEGLHYGLPTLLLLFTRTHPHARESTMAESQASWSCSIMSHLEHGQFMRQNRTVEETLSPAFTSPGSSTI